MGNRSPIWQSSREHDGLSAARHAYRLAFLPLLYGKSPRSFVMRIDTLRPAISDRLAVIAIGATLRAAAVALSKSHVGLVVVCDERSRAAGVVTKSDIVRYLMCVGVAEAPVATLMSRDIVSCAPEDDLYATWQRMTARSLQTMPVLGADAKPLGVLDIRDALKALFEQEQYQERLYFNYITGIGYQ
jgi:CBS domain-containing protein